MTNWAAVLAGGSGTRFWPLSTAGRPKQMLSLVGQKPLIQETIERLEGLIAPEQTLIITGRTLAEETKRLLPTIPPENVLTEPRAASTAPALTWATLVASERDRDAAVLSLHADWFVGDDAMFRDTALRALQAARRHDALVTVGVEPTRPESGYGYILPGEALGSDLMRVRGFLEKPDAERAAELIATGALWNSGLFAWTSRRFFSETERVAPEIAPHIHLLRGDDVAGFFNAVTPIAVDVSHFERSNRVVCVPGQFRWDDVGTWAALGRVRQEDESGNVLAGRVFQRQSDGCIAWADDGAVVLDGISDLVVVQANGITLVTTKQRSTQLKDLLDALPEAIRRTQR
ncbi:MAG: mannose-1-phosphate guanylyltransferase [Gemmatimonadota bacterium]|nr:MAG: mannose-1-phosphate guanylyltransferase [Gemmatimonadota bacterium]